MSEARCPCCGAPVEPSRLYVDLNTNTATRGGLIVKLQPRQAELLYALNRAYPNTVNAERLIAILWGGSSPDTADGIVRQQIYYARKAALALGVRVHNVPATGYRLEFVPLAIEAAA